MTLPSVASFMYFLWGNGQLTLCSFLSFCSNVFFLFIEIECYLCPSVPGKPTESWHKNKQTKNFKKFLFFFLPFTAYSQQPNMPLSW